MEGREGGRRERGLGGRDWGGRYGIKMRKGGRDE